MWKLPEPQGRRSRGWEPRRLGVAVPRPEGVPKWVDGVEGLLLVAVSSQDDELFRLWNELMLS